MPTSLEFEDHLAILAREGDRFVALACRVALDAPVPTCPGWVVRDLVAHQGEVHRWATDVVAGTWDGLTAFEQLDRVAAPAGPAIGDWFASGLADLLAALAAAPESLQALVFLPDAPTPRRFWARRQAHETAVHRIDALAAELGRTPTAAESCVRHDQAVDGLDELLLGFLPRPKSRLRSERTGTIAVQPDDADRRWHLAIGPDPVLVEESGRPADVTFSGTAVELYLGLWNRGDGITVSGDPAVLDHWRHQFKVAW